MTKGPDVNRFGQWGDEDDFERDALSAARGILAGLALTLLLVCLVGVLVALALPSLRLVQEIAP